LFSVYKHNEDGTPKDYLKQHRLWK